jgi:hypothetical protein
VNGIESEFVSEWWKFVKAGLRKWAFLSCSFSGFRKNVKAQPGAIKFPRAATKIYILSLNALRVACRLTAHPSTFRNFIQHD